MSESLDHTAPLIGARASVSTDASGKNGGIYPYSAQTDLGLSRQINEDSILALPPLFIVADGMGGHRAGELASSIAVDTIQEFAPHRAETNALSRALRRANKAIIDAVAGGAGHKGMGTTCTALMLKDGQCAIAHVGDSRAYLLRDGRLSQITHDHSVVGAMIRSGHLSVAEARVHPQRNVITRALGSDRDVVVDTHLIPVLPQDRLLVCSDGLTSMIEDAYIDTILTSYPDPRAATQALIDAANNAGGKDNISCIVIDITREGSARRHTPSRSKLWFWASLWLIVTALILAGIGYGIKQYAETKAYLASAQNGTVSIYEGIPGHILGISLQNLSIETTIVLETLSIGDQEKINSNIAYDSVEYAQTALDEMATYAESTNKVKPRSIPQPKTPQKVP